MRARYLRTSKLVKWCLFVTVLLMIGPFYFDVPVTQQREHARSDQNDLQKMMVPCNEDANLCDVELGDETVEQGLADFRDGVLGNYEVGVTINRSGPGEYGTSVYTESKDREAAEKTVAEYGYNMVVSDQIAMDRELPDVRLKECRYWHYPRRLPSASVVIVFHNEGNRTLLRTVHSVINTSPKHLLKEVILIDDNSYKDHLASPLEDYLKRFGDLVKLFRNAVREGFIQSRTKGALLSTGDVIVFLQANCECAKNWLPPLLTRIAYNRTIMAVPLIDTIDWQTFAYYSNYKYGHNSGAFEWSLLYKEQVLPEKEAGTREYKSQPYKSPAHSGDVFAIDRSYFLELGAYDPGLEAMGGENLELSFKIWMCGGSIEWVPCSQVGLVYRRSPPSMSYTDPIRVVPEKTNYLRIVEVWLDDQHKELFYRREPWLRGTPLKHLQPQIDFRKHNCKSFQWYLENIAYKVLSHVPLPPENVYWGQIRPVYTDQCWSGVAHENVLLSPCENRPTSPLQYYRIDVHGRITTGEWCVLYSENKLFLETVDCPEELRGYWEYVKDKNQIRNSKLNRCVAFDQDNPFLQLEACSPISTNQQWRIVPQFMWT